MELINIIFIALTFVLALGASWVLLIPFFEESPSSEPAGSDREMRFADLIERKDKTLNALEDLEQDRDSHFVSDEVYEQSKVELQREAARYLSDLDKLYSENQGAGVSDRKKGD